MAVLNFCLERLHHVTIPNDMARSNRWCRNVTHVRSQSENMLRRCGKGQFSVEEEVGDVGRGVLHSHCQCEGGAFRGILSIEKNPYHYITLLCTSL